ncbi:MAG: hypothetical protein ACR2HE_00105 [Casimicrobiaceae bacterium]
MGGRTSFRRAPDGQWSAISPGIYDWMPLQSSWVRQLNLTSYVKTFVGRFDTWNGADVLALEFTRGSRIFSKGHANFAPHGLYAY